MGIFANWAERFFDYGLQPVPVEPGSKILRLKDHPFFKRKLSAKEIERYADQFPDWHIGIACGEASGVIGIDFDYVGKPDSDEIEGLVLGALPPTPLIKKGSKGWTRFYRYFEGQGTKHFLRDGKPCIDILSNGAVTVMPPSAHSDGMDYQWITPDNFESVHPSELPRIDAQLLSEIKAICSGKIKEATDQEEMPASDKARHTTLFSWINRNAKRFEEMGDLADALLEFDQKIHKGHSKGEYFRDAKYLKNDSPFESAKKFAEKVCEWKRRKLAEKNIQWDIGKSDMSFWIPKESGGYRASGESKDYDIFFEHHFRGAKKDFLDGVVKKPDSQRAVFDESIPLWIPISRELKSTISIARGCGLQKGNVETELSRWMDEKRPEFLWDIPAWDGKDHIGKAFSFVKVSNIEHEFMVDLMREWFATIFKRAKDPKIQNTCPIFQGRQGLGKDWFIGHLMEPIWAYYSSFDFADKPKENYETAKARLVLFVPEFDSVMKKRPDQIKSFITANKTAYRDSYARDSTDKYLRHSCIASLNPEFFSNDPTGNRRFQLFKMEDLDWAYEKSVNSAQVFAQAAYLSKQDYRASKEAKAAMDKVMEDFIPESNEMLFLEECLDLSISLHKNAEMARIGSLTGSGMLGSRVLKGQEFRIKYRDVKHDFYRIGKDFSLNKDSVNKLLKRGKLTQRVNGDIWLSKPQYA